MPRTHERPAAERYLEFWQGGRPDVEAFLRESAPQSIAEMVAVLRIDLQQRFAAGEAVSVEAYFDRFPALREDETAAIDLIYSEFMLRETGGESPGDPPSSAEYAARFPQYAETLAAQFALHRMALSPSTPAPTIELSPSKRGALTETLVERRQASPAKGPSEKSPLKRGTVASIFIALAGAAAVILCLIAYARRGRSPGASAPSTPTAIAPAPVGDSPSDPLAAVDLLADEWLSLLPAGWAKVDGELESDEKVVINNLKLKSVSATRYRIECEFSAKNAHDAIYFMLPVGQRQCFFAVNAYPDGATDTSVSGFGDIDGQSVKVNVTGVRRRKLKQGERHRLTIEASLVGEKATLAATLDDLPSFGWNGPVASLAVPYSYQWPERQTFGIGAIQASYRVHSLVYRELHSGD